MDVAVQTGADSSGSSLTARDVSRGGCDDGAANEGGDDGCGEHFDDRCEFEGSFVRKMLV